MWWWKIKDALEPPRDATVVEESDEQFEARMARARAWELSHPSLGRWLRDPKPKSDAPKSDVLIGS